MQPPSIVIPLAHPPRVPAAVVLNPAQLSRVAQDAVRDLLREGDSENTLSSYRSALKYWAGWFFIRFGQALALPVPVPVVLQFIVDHAARTTKEGLVCELPPAFDQALVAHGFKSRLGPPALNTLSHRLSVLSKTHQLAGQPNPCADTAVRELVAKTRRAYAKRGAGPQKQNALTRAPLEAILATCDDSLKGRRDHALLLFAWSTGGRRRSEVTSAVIENLRKVEDGSYVYRLGFSKTNQAGVQRAEDTKPLVGSAARAMESWLTASKITSGALFRRIRKGGHVGEALSPAAVRDIVKARCALAGIDGTFAAHSLRSGFVTEAGRQEVPLAETMAMTGHRSVATVVAYFRSEGGLSSPAARLMDRPSPPEPKATGSGLSIDRRPLSSSCTS